MPSQGHVKRRPTVESADKPVKRTRVSRACDQCRIAREKCDGLQPTCSTCSTSKRKCTYTANPKKRGIQPGYIRSLELALAWLFQQNPKNETSISEKLEREGASSLFLSRGSKESNKLHKRWRKARFYLDIDKLLSGGEPSRLEHSEHFALHSDDEDSETEETAISVEQSEQVPKNLPRVEPAPLYQLEQQLQFPIMYPTQSSANVSLPPDSWRYLDNYFTYTQSWLPICEKYDVLKLSYSYPTQGLPLLFAQPDSGAHAELWSILAVGSLHDQMNLGIASGPSTTQTTPEQLYDTARSLLPNELGSINLVHIKAFLNLAIFNISQSNPEAAWILVGFASRILEGGDQSRFTDNPRYKHAFSGCFLLDNMLALQLERRAHFQMRHIQIVGKIDEDGIEEWQPWNDQSDTPSIGRQTPILGLSTFNSLLHVVDLLASDEQSTTSTNEHDIGSRLRMWRASLPSKLNYILSNTMPTPLNPPAILLHMTYYCAALVSTQSGSWLHKILDLLEQCQERIGLISVPPAIHCLMTFLQNHTIRLHLDEATQTRLQTIELCLQQVQAPSRSKNRLQAQDTTPTMSSSKQSIATSSVQQIQTPESLQFPLSMAQPHATSPQMQHIPRTHGSSIPSNPSFDPLLIVSDPPPSDPQFSDISGEFESFFDELASLDRTKKQSSQPQFLQNLGFAPNASMADLFSDFIPIRAEGFERYDIYGS